MAKRKSKRVQIEDIGVKSLTKVDREEVEKSYNQNTIRYKGLLEEAVFVLDDKIATADIKIHGIEKRIKTLESVVNKCERKGQSDLSSLADIVGARVVCLFRSDMSRVGNLILESFDVVDVDDKISDRGPLGYMSAHYVCKIPDRYSGPRYENTRDLLFEIQVRTLCMHAWAAVSHYLDYKGDWDVPEDLKRALSALGGLFYVADSEFEQFYSARVQSKLEAEKKGAPKPDQDINLDTMTSFLMQKYPDREHANLAAISSLVHEIKEAGYVSTQEVEQDADRGLQAFGAYEKQHPPTSGRRYSDVGVLRITLRIVSERMREVGIKKLPGKVKSRSVRDYGAFNHFVRARSQHD